MPFGHYDKFIIYYHTPPGPDVLWSDSRASESSIGLVWSAPDAGKVRLLYLFDIELRCALAHGL